MTAFIQSFANTCVYFSIRLGRARDSVFVTCIGCSRGYLLSSDSFEGWEIFGSQVWIRKQCILPKKGVHSTINRAWSTQQTLLRWDLLLRTRFVGRLSRWSDEGWHHRISPTRRKAFDSKDWSNPVEAFNKQPEKDGESKSESQFDDSISNLTISLEIHCPVKSKVTNQFIQLSCIP